MSRYVYTPSEINREVRAHIEAGFPRLWVEGEISNLAKPASGHLYFTLKDQRAQLRCALFRGNASRLNFEMENGQQVQVRGRLGLYEGRGEFQMVADKAEAAGEGQLRAAFEALKKKLEAQGLFDAGHRQPLPQYPTRIAVITSPGGAVIRDIVHVLGRRWPLAQVRLYPSPVQGEDAPGRLVAAINAMNRHGWAEVGIIGRGGGSLEDLWAFNNEQLALAVHHSDTPLVSAVGHETDFSISDFVADLRAPTPSAAAEILTPDQIVLKRQFGSMLERLASRTGSELQRRAQRLDELAARLNSQHPKRKLEERGQQLKELRHRKNAAMRRRLAEQQRILEPVHARFLSLSNSYWPTLSRPLLQWQDRLFRAGHELIKPRRKALSALARTLNAVSPLTILDRGYAVVTLPQTGAVVRRPEQVDAGDEILTQLGSGHIHSVVKSTSNN